MQGQLLILTHLMIDLSPKYEPKPERPSDLDPFKPYLREGIEAAKGGRVTLTALLHAPHFF